MRTYLDKECDGFPAIEQTVVVGESKVHHLNVMLVQNHIVEEMLHTGRTSTLPLTTTARSLIACRPRTAVVC